MGKWIDADALIVELQKDEERFDKEADDCRKNSRNYTDCYMQAMSSRADGIRDAIIEVYDAPSIDIVRCQDCRHRYMDADLQVWTCTYGLMIKPDGFCNYGEVRDE